jgi:hypothetical protein
MRNVFKFVHCAWEAGVINDPKIEEFLTDPDNLALALELEPIIAEIKISIFRRFWGHVREELQARLQEGDYHWALTPPGEVNDSYSLLGLVDKYDVNSEIPGRYAFLFESLTGRPYSGIFGIRRGEPNKSPGPADQDLVGRLRGLGFKTSDQWVGFTYLAKSGGVAIQISNKETIVALSRDNRNENHTMAKRFAGLLWEIFEQFCPLVEELNNSLPVQQDKSSMPSTP